MDVFGNALLSKNFMYSGLVLTDEALYESVSMDGITEKGRVFLTKDPEIICSLIGLSFGEVVSAEEDEFYELLAQSPMFRVQKFLSVKPNNTYWMLEAFAEYLFNAEELNREFSTVPKEEYINLNPNYEQEYEDEVLFITRGRKGVGRIFSGLTIKSYFPNYDMTRLSTTIPKFWDSFNSKKEAVMFLLKNDNTAIHEKFLELTE